MVNRAALTSRGERLAHLLFQGLSEVDAYVQVHRPRTTRKNSLYAMSSRACADVKVQSRLQELRDAATTALIADEIERQEFWTTTMRSKDEETKDRLRASELLGKAQGDFVERPENKGRQEISIRVVYEDRPRIVDGTVHEEGA